MPIPPPSLVFGPVPSRRLGRSLGVNHIPPKVCTYACAYCQVGPTTEATIQRRAFFPPEQVARQVEAALARAAAVGEPVDFVTLVPDGEPTLDLHLGRLVGLLRALGTPVAVITNGSLLWREEVRAELAQAAWVSVKVDTVDPGTWRRLNRPSRHLALDQVLAGAEDFARGFGGTLVTETLLVDGLNDGDAELSALAGFLPRLSPTTAWISTPVRPPTAPWVRPPGADRVAAAWALLSACLPRVGLLQAPAEGPFASLSDADADLVATCAVHPMERADALDLLARAGQDPGVLDRLVAAGWLAEAPWQGRVFYLARRREAGGG